MAPWNGYYVIPDINVHILYEQGFPGRSGVPGAKVMLMIIFGGIFVYVFDSLYM